MTEKEAIIIKLNKNVHQVKKELEKYQKKEEKFKMAKFLEVRNLTNEVQAQQA
jgi:hypothetical protein